MIRKKWSKRSWSQIISYMFLTLLTIVSIFPIFWIIITSLKSPGETSENPLALIPKNLTFDNYMKVFSELGFGQNLFNSLVVSLSTTMIAIVISCMAAYAIVRFFPRGGKVISRILLSTYMFPPILLAVPFSVIFAQMGLINTWVGLIIAYLSFSIPFAVWMLVGFFKTVPLSIEESASVDGASIVRTFVQIVIPIVIPGIVATAIYTFINAWNEFLFALLFINSTEKMTISVALDALTGSEVLDWGVMMAASTIVVLPTVIFFMIIQDKISAGLSDGSVK